MHQGDGDELDEENPLGTPVESFVRVSPFNTNLEHKKELSTYICEERSISQVFIMSLGEFGDLWDAIDGTQYIMIGD